MARKDDHISNVDGQDYYINIDDYYDRIHRTTWVRRTSGFLAGASYGALIGSVIGAISAFIPHLLTAMAVAGVAAPVLPALGAVGAAAAVFAFVGAGLGMAINADVAANSASTAAGMEEKEKRERIERLRGSAPEKRFGLAQESVNGNAPEEKSLLSRSGPPLFSWKVAAVTVPLFAAFGVLAAFAAPSMIAGGLGVALTGHALLTASAAVFGLFGVTMGLKNSLISNKLSNFYYKILSEEAFAKSPEPEISKTVPVPAQEKGIEKPVEEPAVAAEQKPANYFAKSRTKFSIKGMIEHHESGASQETVITR